MPSTRVHRYVGRSEAPGKRRERRKRRKKVFRPIKEFI
jgi:hypothetical protein